MAKEVKNPSQNFKQIARRRFTLLNIVIRIVRSTLSLNSKQFRQKLYSNGFYIVDMTCPFS